MLRRTQLLRATYWKSQTPSVTLDSTFTAGEVSKGIAQLKNKKASGNDLISNEIIETCSLQFFLFLSHFLTLY